MSVSVLYYKVSPERISSAQQSELINSWIEELPLQKQQQIRKLRQQNDQVLSLAGLQLLKIGMSEFYSAPFSLKKIQFPEKSKPFFEGNIDFNISHSGEIVCCVLSDSMEVGIDIEKQREVTPATMNKFLSGNDKSEITSKNTADNDMQKFFKLWTINEAIIKAANHGSIFNMSEITFNSEGGFYQDKFWFTCPININSDTSNKEYTCHIACSEKITDSAIKIKQIINL